MPRKRRVQAGASKAAFPITKPWLWLSIAAAVLAVGGNVVALSVRSIYASLTPVFLPQALAILVYRHGRRRSGSDGLVPRDPIVRSVCQ